MLKFRHLFEETKIGNKTFDDMELCPGAIKAFKKDYETKDNKEEILSAAQAVDDYLAIERKGLDGNIDETDLEKMKGMVDVAKKKIADAGLSADDHDYHQGHIDTVKALVKKSKSIEEGVGEVLGILNFAMFGALALGFITSVGMELGVIKGSDSKLKDAKDDIALLKRRIQKNKQYKLDSFDKERLNNALKIIRNAKPTAFQKLKTKLKDLAKKNKTVKEKTLTPAEIKKRDEIAKAMKKDDPDMPMDKKMAIATATAKRVAEGKIQETVKTTHVVIDTANGNKVVATASDEKGAKASVASAERPPMNIKNKKTLKIVKLKRPVGDKQSDRMVGYPLNETVSAALHIKGMRTAMAHAKKDGANVKDKNVFNKYFIYHMKKNNRMTHFKKLPSGGLDFNSIGDGTKIEPKHYKDIFKKTKKEELEMTSITESTDLYDKGGIQIVRHAAKGRDSRGRGKLEVDITIGRKTLTLDETQFKNLQRALPKINLKKGLGEEVELEEAVSPAQQAAIAISKKERGEKPKNEASAAADARRAMKSRGATKGMALTKKDKDTEATDDDRKAASKNIIMQLRKAADLPTGAEVVFNRGKGKVSRDQAKAALARFDGLSKPNEKERFQKGIRSLADIKKILGR